MENMVNGFMDSGDYQVNIRKIKTHDPALKIEWGRIVAPVRIPGENHPCDCVTLGGAFRINEH